MEYDYYSAWQDPDHAKLFDHGSLHTSKGLKKYYESLNEVQLLLENASLINQNGFLELGCATGELYRYIKKFHPRFDYYGVDISKLSIKRAKHKYPKGKFFLCKKDLSDVDNFIKEPAILFSRDVVLHAVKPFDFLAQLISIPTEAVFLRIRTRDKGESLLDPEFSCMLHNNTWIPYMVQNIDETIECIRKTVNFNSLYILKYYQQLGGYNGRFLPKDCYYPETKTAETAIYIQLSKEKVVDPQIIIKEQTDGHVNHTLFERILRRVKKEFSDI